MSIPNQSVTSTSSTTDLPAPFEYHSIDTPNGRIVAVGLHNLIGATKDSQAAAEKTLQGTAKQIPALTPAAEQAILKLRLPQVLSFLEMYDKELANIGFLTLEQTIALANTTLIILALKENPSAQSQLKALFSHDIDKSQPNWKHSYQKILSSLWENSQISPERQQKMQKCSVALMDLSECTRLLQEQTVKAAHTATMKQQALKSVCQITQDLAQHYVSFFRASNDRIEAVIKAHIYPPIKKKATKSEKEKTHKQELKHDLEKSVFDRANEEFARLQAYAQTRIPKLRRILSSKTFHDSNRIEAIVSTAKSYLVCMNAISAGIKSGLARYECFYNLNGMAPIVSPRADAMLHSFYERLLNNYIESSRTIVQHVQKVTVDNIPFFPEVITTSEFSSFFNAISKALIGEVSQSNIRSENLSKIATQVVKIIQDERESSIIRIERLFKELGSESKINAATRNIFRTLASVLERLSSKLSSEFSNKTTEIGTVFQFLQSTFLREIKVVQSHLKDDNYYKKWKQDQIKETRDYFQKNVGALNTKLAKFSNEKDAHECDFAVSWMTAAEKFSDFFCRYLNVLAACKTEVPAPTGLTEDDWLTFLETEVDQEESPPSSVKGRKEKHAAELESVKEKNAESEEANVTLTPTSVIRSATVQSVIHTFPYNSRVARLFSALRNEISLLNGLPINTFVVPQQIAHIRLSKAMLAAYDQRYAFDNFCTCLEMFEKCTVAEDRILITERLLHWGYLILERGLTKENLERCQNAKLYHSLTSLLHTLEINLKNIWTDHNDRGTLFIRYPFCYRAQATLTLPFALTHIRNGSAASTKEFDTKMNTWCNDAIVIVSTRSNSTLDRMREIRESLEKKEESSKEKARCDSIELSDAHTERVAKAMSSLSSEMELFSKHLKATTNEEQQKMLLNAQHHLVNLNRAIGLMIRNPDQRYAHEIGHLLILSTHYFVENLGVYLSLKEGQKWHTHDLNEYRRLFGLGEGLSRKQLLTLAAINAGKGTENPFKYFSRSREQTPESMTFLSEYYARANEALIMGIGAVPSGMEDKSFAAMQEELVHWAERIISLVSGLIHRHCQ